MVKKLTLFLLSPKFQKIFPSKVKKKIATIILAAGESKRMDGIKQLLPWKDSTLLGHAITQSLQSSTNEIYVVLGAKDRKSVV